MERVHGKRGRIPPWLCVFPAAVFVVVTALALGAGADDGGLAGDEMCGQCHEAQAQAFATTAHGRAAGDGGWQAPTCEGCHGPGQAHADSGGETDKINAGSAGLTDACLACHGGDAAAHWRASSHDDFDLTCDSCHKVHTSWTNDRALKNQKVSEACLDCHKDMKKHLYQRSSHPLRDGLMACTSCHDPHGSAAESAMASTTPNDKCYECHAEKRGPFLFEHAPVREDCGVCHNPHGSNQTMLLKTSPPRLCQSCHLFGHHQTVPGQSAQVWNQNRSCVNCHPRIHGSNHPSGVIFMR